MKTETILKAIATLEAARTHLNTGYLSIEAQIALASECSRAAFHLQRELIADVPELKVAA